MSTSEQLPDNKEELNGSLGIIKKSLCLLEINTRTDFFSKTTRRLKNLFGYNPAETENLNPSELGYTNDVEIVSNISVDRSGFTPGPYPFKHITRPYKGIKAYRVDNVKIDPLIGFSQLSLKGTEGELSTLKLKDFELHYNNKKAIGYKKNNPCNVSPYPDDIGRRGSSRIKDGQDHAGYSSMVDGLASFMKLMRKSPYRNKSIQGINCSGLQGVYDKNEPESLKALRIIWITRASKSLNISPFTRINTDDKETMMAFAQQTAINETGSYFDRATLEKAYIKAFG